MSERTLFTPSARGLVPCFGVLLRVAVVWLMWAAPALAQADRPPLTVVVSIHPLAMLVNAVGGDAVQVTTLLPPGASPHGFELSPSRVRKLAAADLLVRVGGGLDLWVQRVAQAVRADRPDLVLAQQVTLRPVTAPIVTPHTPGAHHDHDHGDGGDPHFWLDPVIVRDRVVPALVAALSALAPDRVGRFERQGARVQEELTRLHAEITAALAPYAGGAFIAFHGTWSYFAERYGLHQVAVLEPLPGREPSARWMMSVIAAAHREKARAILIEPQFNARPARTIAGQFKGRVILADPIGNPEKPSGRSYAELMRANMRAFAKALAP